MLKFPLITLIRLYKGYLPYKFEHMKCWNSFIYYTMLCSPIDDYHNIKRIIQIGLVLMEKVEVEVMRNWLIPLWKILLYYYMVSWSI